MLWTYNADEIDCNGCVSLKGSFLNVVCWSTRHCMGFPLPLFPLTASKPHQDGTCDHQCIGVSSFLHQPNSNAWWAFLRCWRPESMEPTSGHCKGGWKCWVIQKKAKDTLIWTIVQLTDFVLISVRCPWLWSRPCIRHFKYRPVNNNNNNNTAFNLHVLAQIGL